MEITASEKKSETKALLIKVCGFMEGEKKILLSTLFFYLFPQENIRQWVTASRFRYVLNTA